MLKIFITIIIAALIVKVNALNCITKTSDSAEALHDIIYQLGQYSFNGYYFNKFNNNQLVSEKNGNQITLTVTDGYRISYADGMAYELIMAVSGEYCNQHSPHGPVKIDFKCISKASPNSCNAYSNSKDGISKRADNQMDPRTGAAVGLSSLIGNLNMQGSTMYAGNVRVNVANGGVANFGTVNNNKFLMSNTQVGAICLSIIYKEPILKYTSIFMSELGGWAKNFIKNRSDGGCIRSKHFDLCITRPSATGTYRCENTTTKTISAYNPLPIDRLNPTS